jgi:hypothetical protein
VCGGGKIVKAKSSPRAGLCSPKLSSQEHFNLNDAKPQTPIGRLIVELRFGKRRWSLRETPPRCDHHMWVWFVLVKVSCAIMC